jgi:probable rRNA maturation factor
VQGARLLKLARRFLSALDLDGVELSLTLVRDERIRELNRLWRDKDSATDVLSFPGGDDLPGPGPRMLGDVVISLDTARRQAKALGTTFEDELSLYLAHGLLHLLGHDHHSPREAQAMAREERRLLGTGGMLFRSGEGETPRGRFPP